MLTMAVVHSDDVDPMDAIATVIDQCRGALGNRAPKAGMLLSVFESFQPEIVAAVRSAFPGVSVMGSTSAAEVSSVGGFLEDSITLALFDSDVADVTTGLSGGLGDDVEAACRAAVGEARSTTAREPKLCVVFAEGFVVDPQVTLDAMARALPPGVVLVGGGSARRDLGTTTPTHQFRDERVVQDGVAVLLFSGDVSFSVAVGTGFRAIGPPGTVTRAERGRIDEVGRRPHDRAVQQRRNDLLTTWLRRPLDRALTRTLVEVGACRGDPVARAALAGLVREPAVGRRAGHGPFLPPGHRPVRAGHRIGDGLWLGAGRRLRPAHDRELG